MKILLLGSNPSGSSANNTAFDVSTNSGRTLSTWMAMTGCHPCSCHNVSNTPTPNNRPLTVGEIKANLARLNNDINMVSPDKIVAVGKTAAKALTLLRLEFFELPHPSGLNRQLNDPKFIEEKIKKLAEFINEPSSI